MHPHGTSVGFGFTLNGAVRFKAKRPDLYLPAEVTSLLSDERLARISGVQAPLLFRLPLVRPMMLLFGCCTPATKEGMFGLFRQRSDFGILPGGMEEATSSFSRTPLASATSTAPSAPGKDCACGCCAGAASWCPSSTERGGARSSRVPTSPSTPSSARRCNCRASPSRPPSR
mmetsp:Transcript_6384/g.21229  ORF Transcript_6384/g.21229 Transcript_6384/m.21229 type:complete len:173 (+) Transcript_6384:572-1090(+)